MTDLIELALDDLVPSFADAEPDWLDVVSRSRRVARVRTPLPRRQPRPRRTLALVLGLLLIVLLATPALGVQGYVLHLLGRKNVSFSHSPSAPNVVKKQFFDLPLGAPRAFAPEVNAARTRVVATFPIAGHPRRLYVTPTRKGGYCYVFEGSYGGCRQTRSDRRVGDKGQFGVNWQSGYRRRGMSASIVTRVGGDITAPTAAKIIAAYADGTKDDVPFVWVSSPIAAGFFTFDIPAVHWIRQHRLLALTLVSKSGAQLGRQTFPDELRVHRLPRPIPPPRARTLRARVLPAAPAVAPSAPTQSGSADGFRVVVGHNGAVQFTQVAETPILRELAGRSVSYSCSRLTKVFGISDVRGFGQAGRLASRVGFVLNGVRGPVDACEISASIGHRWPDRLHNRAAVQIPLTTTGASFLEDRQAARDLSLFVRSRRAQELRKEPARQARVDLLRAFRTPLARSSIRITVMAPATLAFTERSTTGKLFAVTVQHGRIVGQNVKPYALVF